MLRLRSMRVAGAATLVLSLLLGLLSQTGSLAAPSEAELDAAQDRLMDLEAEFEIAVEEYNLVHENLTEIQARIGTAELEVRAIERRMGTRQEAAVEVATELYMGGSTEALEAVLSASDFNEVQSRLEYLQTTQVAQAELFEGLASDRSELEAKLEKLEEDRAAALAAEERLVALQADVEEKLASQEYEVAELRAEIERAERLAEARAAAAAEARAEAASVPVAAPAPPAAAPAPNAGAQTAVDAALSQVGKPYQWAAAGPDSYDCSGLTMWAWARAGVALPHNSGMQYSATPRVDQSDWQPGDLLFFGSPIHHVAMYIGNGQMVEAPYSGAQVRVVSASRSDYVGAGRPGA